MNTPACQRRSLLFSWLFLVSAACGFATQTVHAQQSYSPEQRTTAHVSSGSAGRHHVIRNPGIRVNSIFEDLNPVITADGTTLYFARKNAPGNQGGRMDPQDIYVAVKSGGRWTTPRNLGPSVNTAMADNLCGVSPGHDRLYFFVRGAGNKGYFGYRERTASGWTEMRHTGLAITNESPFLESCISPSGNVILFTARTRQNVRYARGNGERDVYVSVRGEDGNWSRPQNLGPVINSAADEYSPFLAADEKTLYFATNGRTDGLGGVDLYVTRRTGPGWTDWTEPENLGPGINSAGFDAYFCVDPAGKTAYFSTHAASIGRADIISIDLPEQFRPERVILVNGRVSDSRTGLPVSGTVSVTDAHGDHDQLKPFVMDYAVVVRPGKIRIDVHAPGHAPATKLIEVPNETENSIERVDFALDALTPRRVLTRPLLFDEGKAVLKAQSKMSLDSVVILMRANPVIVMEIRGHTDNRGPEKSLRELSKNRVSEVIRYLRNQGIPSGRLKGRAFGSTQPISKNDTDDHRSRNRRVEFRIRKW